MGRLRCVSGPRGTAPLPCEGGPRAALYHRAGFFTDGHRATWEYPRETPSGEHMDFVEVMEIEDGLIHAHRVYWVWRGVDA
jgi:hypothetical protein